MTDRNSSQRLKTTPSEPSMNSCALQQSAIEANTKSFRFQHSQLQILQRGYLNKSRARTLRPLKATIMQSLSQKHLPDKSSRQPANKYYYSTANLQAIESDSDVVGLLREKCSKYERTIGELYEGKEEQQRELENAKSEVSRLKDLYESKLGQVHEVSQEITSRIEREQADKNLFIKEINNRNIEINRLREAQAILKAENQTLSLVLKEKQAEIDGLESAMEEADGHRKKLESYQLAVSGSNSLLRDIEEQTRQLERESEEKDRVIADLQTSVNGFLDKLRQYEQKILELQQAANASLQEQAKWRQSVADAQAQAEEWKQNYIECSRQLQQLPQLQIRLKNTLLTNSDLQARIQQLLDSQQQLKLQVGSQSLRQKRLSELESTVQGLQRLVKDRQEQAAAAQDQVSKLVWELREANTAQERITEMQKVVEEQAREMKALERKCEEKGIICGSLEREVRRLNDENDKIKERNQKIDHVFKENKRLTGTLMQKIDQIQRLQHTVNALQSRIATLSNQILKLTALYDQANDACSQLSCSLQTSQMRLQCQLNLKAQLQDKLQRSSNQCSSLNKALNKQREAGRTLQNERQSLRRELEETSKELQSQNSSYEKARAEWHCQIAVERRRVEEVTAEGNASKRRAEQIQKREREQGELIGVLEADKRAMLAEFSSLRTNYEQAVAKLNVFEKWKSGYMSFSLSYNRAAQEMQQTAQQLLA